MIEIGVLKHFDSGSYRAGVQLAGSLTTYLDHIPVSVAVPPSALVIGNRVILAIPGGNPGDAVIIASWPQGTAMGVHGNDYHDPDFATEGDFNAHASRHKWGGPDEVNIKDLFCVCFNPFYYKDWADLNGWTASHSGSGSFATSFRSGIMQTGTTSGSRSLVYSGDPFRFDAAVSAQRQRWGLSLQPRGGAVAYCTLWFGCLSSPAAPSDTQYHVAFKIVDGILYASCGNGTAGTQVDTGITLAQYTTYKLNFKYMEDDIKFYVDDALKATIAANRPSGVYLHPCCYALNGEAANKEWWVYPMIIVGAPD